MFTLSTLLVVSMLLISFVIVILWQRQYLRFELEKGTLFLELAIGNVGLENDEHGQPGVSSRVQKLIVDDSTSCLRMKSGEKIYSLIPSCVKNDVLDSLLSQSASSGNKIHKFTGVGWEILTTTSKLLVAVPVQKDDNAVSAIGMSRDLLPFYQELRSHVKVALIYILINTVILAVVGFFRLSSLFIRPLDRLVKLAESGSDRDGMILFESDDGDEFAKLTRSLNRMIKRIAADNEKLRSSVQSLEKANKELEHNRQEMVRVEKLAAVGRLSAGLAHEIGNPLGIIQGYIGMLGRDEGTGDEKIEYLVRIESELDRINDLMQQLLGFSRFGEKQSHIFSVHQVLSDIIELVRIRGQLKAVRFVERFQAENDLLTANSDSLKQVFLNCFFNSIDAIEEKGDRGEILVETENRQNNLDETVLAVSIIDNGKGIEAENIDKIFDPFFTTKEVGRGTGLGLFVSHTILENLGGRMRAESESGDGTRIIIELIIGKGKDGCQ